MCLCGYPKIGCYGRKVSMLVSMCVVLDSQGLATKPQVGCLPSTPLTKLMGWFGHLVVVFNLGTFATWVYGSSVMSRWIR